MALRYIVVAAPSVALLEAKVNEKLICSYKTIGGVAINKCYYYQAMIKKINKAAD